MKNINNRSFYKSSAILRTIVLAIGLLLPMGMGFAMQVNVPLGEVAQEADLIFIGTVEQQESYFNQQQTLIMTEVLFKDMVIVHSSDRSRQKESAAITLAYAGGCVDGLCLDTSTAPSFRTGRRYLLFVSDDGKTYINPIIGGSQGFFEVIRDNRTGEEFVLTADKKAITAVNSRGIGRSKWPVSAIEDGLPVYDPGQSAHTDRATVLPPTPASPLDRASVSSILDTGAGEISPALGLAAFIDYIKNSALTEPLSYRLLKRPGQEDCLGNSGTKMEQKPLDLELLPVLSFPAAGTSGPGTTPGMATTDSPVLPQGGQLGACGHHSLPFTIEMVPEAWWSYNTFEACRTTWNNFMEVYRKKVSDGKVGGHNGQNEICGWFDDATMFQNFGVHWNNYLAWAHTWYYTGSPCGKLIESDIAFNPAYTWTDDETLAIGNNDLVLLRPVAMHELAHTWGMQRGVAGSWGFNETYDYDKPTVVHSYYHSIVENGRGIHPTDAYCFRRDYSKYTAIKENLVDVGVESYYADNGLKNATATGSTYSAGSAISLKNITVENNSYKQVADVRIRIYLSKDRTITGTDYQVGTFWFWATFTAESYTVFNLDSTVPVGIPAGIYYIGIIITVNGDQQDNYSPNNSTSFFATITIKGGADGGDDDGGGKCFIATAAYDSPHHPYVKIFRGFRDRVLVRGELGRQLVDLYYKYSPFPAEVISRHESLRAAVRQGLTPLAAICSLLLR